MARPTSPEWLETDGLGGFASGCVSGPRTRRYHGLLVAATTPPVGRKVLVSGLDVEIETPGGRWWLSSQRYAGGTPVGEDGQHLESFVSEPWPIWTFQLPDGTRVVQEILMRAGTPKVFVAWRLLAGSRALAAAAGRGRARLTVRPFLAGRDFHALMHENGAFSFDPEIDAAFLRFRPYAGGPAISISCSGVYQHQPSWYRRFLYEEERRRGLDSEEDLASPGLWTFELGSDEAAMVFGAELGARDTECQPARQAIETARAHERPRRAGLGQALDRAADQYLVARGTGLTVIAGYPWFGDWGRDTFIALRGLCLARGRVAEAIAVLSAWGELVSEGMLPNFFPDGRGEPEYNAVDASLWYVVTVAEAVNEANGALAEPVRRHLIDTVEAILTGYARGTRFGIHATDDGLLAAGVPGQQLTWMDARVAGREVTPRIGKPVEIQALWLNALAAAAMLEAPSAARWCEIFERGRTSFEARFWDQEHGRLFDVVDRDHRPGAVDASFRPNQILAVGGLPISVLSEARARRVVDAVEAALVTPMGLRTLAPEHPDYQAHYRGGAVERDAAYHQGTVWPWLMGPFVEAFVRVNGADDQTKRLARARFLLPLTAHLAAAGIGHVSEVADGDAPHDPGGCPFQAWSLGELIRLERVVLAPNLFRRPDRGSILPPRAQDQREGGR